MSDAQTAIVGGARRAGSLPDRPLHVAVVGATGNVGTVMLQVLAEHDVSVASLRVLASERSVGRQLESGELVATVENLETADPAGLDVALFSAGAGRAREHAQRFADAGVVVIDNSSAFRFDADVPLVVPEVNPNAAFTHQGIIANPNCSTIQLLLALKPIQDAAGLTRVRVSTYQAVSGTGVAAIEELASQHADLAHGRPVGEPAVYPQRIALSALPHAGDFEADGWTTEEHKLTNESRKILGLPQLRIAGTCVRVPVTHSHSEDVWLETERPLSADEARDLLREAPGILVLDDPARGVYPTAEAATGRDEVLVGRIREDPTGENALALFVVGDNLRKGAATNAVQILELLAQG